MQSKTFLDTLNTTMVLIKISEDHNSCKLTRKYWFWHKKLGQVTGRLGTHAPFSQINYPQKICMPVEDIDRDEIQIGDSCFVRCTEFPKPEVLLVVGVENNGNFIFEDKHNKLHSGITILNYIIISNNFKNQSKNIRTNLINATSKEELDFLKKFIILSLSII